MHKLILAQLRWLGHLVSPERLTAKLIDLVMIAPASIKADIIACIPDIVNDAEHSVSVLLYSL